jgi:hypothetical protein
LATGVKVKETHAATEQFQLVIVPLEFTVPEDRSSVPLYPLVRSETLDQLPDTLFGTASVVNWIVTPIAFALYVEL